MGIGIKKDFGRIMTIKTFCVTVLLISVLDAFAYQFTLEGTVGDKYPIVIEVDRTSNGAIKGRYAYNSTLNKLGRNNRNAWLYIQPDGDSNRKYTITDANGKVEEHWDITMSRRNGVNILEGSLVNAKGNRFTVEAKSVSSDENGSTQITTQPDRPQAQYTFSSYRGYTCNADRYLPDALHSAPAKIIIDTSHKTCKIEVKSTSNSQWTTVGSFHYENFSKEEQYFFFETQTDHEFFQLFVYRNGSQASFTYADLKDFKDVNIDFEK